MSTDPIGTPGPMAAVPVELRERIVSGMRWMLWLSVLSVPFSYGISVVLARIGPEALGTYGLLGVYIGLVATLFYFGGNSAVIKFIPELTPEERVSFFLTYLLVICVALIPWLAVAGVWPGTLRYLFGERSGAPFQVLILCLSPIFIVFSLSLAGLTGMLEIKWAKGLDRMVTVGSFATYSVLFLAAPGVLVEHYTGLIWTIYLGFTAVAAGLGLTHFFHLNRWQKYLSPIRFYLPTGFWPYTLGLQGSSALGFLMGRLEYLFLLNAGGLSSLGKYVAVLMIGSVAVKPMAFIFDSLMPGLTNTFARKDGDSSQGLVATYARIVFPIGLAAACFVLFFTGPILRLLGPRYGDLGPLVKLYAPFAAIAGLNGFFSTILNASGHSQSVAAAKALRIALVVAIFWPLWARYHLGGAIASRAIAEVLHQFMVVGLVYWRSGLKLSLSRTYVPFAVLLATAGAMAEILGFVSWMGSFAFWLGFLLAFLVCARYSISEMSGLVRLILPLPSRGAEDLGG
jgi:O-antigen/teichoic acid export membrane protein